MAKHREEDRYGFLDNRGYQEAVGAAIVRGYQPRHRAHPSFHKMEIDWSQRPHAEVWPGVDDYFEHLATDDATKIGDLI